MMELVIICALPTGGRYPPGRSTPTTHHLIIWWSSQPDSSNPHSSTPTTPGMGHSRRWAGSFPRVMDRCYDGWDL